jgi:hypothetical protein
MVRAGYMDHIRERIGIECRKFSRCRGARAARIMRLVASTAADLPAIGLGGVGLIVGDAELAVVVQD